MKTKLETYIWDSGRLVRKWEQESSEKSPVDWLADMTHDLVADDGFPLTSSCATSSSMVTGGSNGSSGSASETSASGWRVRPFVWFHCTDLEESIMDESSRSLVHELITRHGIDGLARAVADECRQMRLQFVEPETRDHWLACATYYDRAAREIEKSAS